MNKHRVPEGTTLVDIEKIDFIPGPYCMSYGFDHVLLSRSIEKVGLINSPILIENACNRFDIVIGFRRMHALKALGYSKVPCRILSNNKPQLECLLLALHDNMTARKFNDVEKGMVIKRLSQSIKNDEILRHYTSLLGLPSHEPVLAFYLRLEDELEDEIKQFLINNRLSLHAVRLLLELDKDARVCLANLLSILKCNFNQQKHLIELSLDISNSSGLAISEVLKDGSIIEILDDSNLNDPQKTNAILRVLRMKIYPRLTKAEDSFRAVVSRLNLPEGVKVTSSPYFESPDYQMLIHFRDGMGLREKIDRLSLMEGLKNIHDPWEANS